MVLKGKKTDYQLVVGLEVHAQVNTNFKLFSTSLNDYNARQNTNVSLFDIAIPGQMPYLNFEVINHAVAFGFAINATINKVSRFDRKHYFYPDLPSGYQITQFFKPIIENGYIDLDGFEKQKRIKINRVHIEQDAGKLVHDKKTDTSYIDFNRAGVPLFEIVTDPDFRSVDEVVNYLEILQAILRFTKVGLADLEKGTFRCDANVSLMDMSVGKFGTRCEIKNLNSFKFIKKAIEFEASRQLEILESGGVIVQETRSFDQEKMETFSLREKSDAAGYSYIPDDSLPPLIINDETLENIKKNLPILPQEKKKKYIDAGLNEKEAKFLSSDPIYSEYFDELLKKYDLKLCVTWVLSELIARLKERAIDFKDSPISSKKMSELLDLIQSGKISGKIAKDVLDLMFDEKKSASEIVAERGLIQVESTDEIMKIIMEVISENQIQVNEYKSGNQKIFGFLVGSAMKKSGGKLNPKLLNEMLKDELAK